MVTLTYFQSPGCRGNFVDGKVKIRTDFLFLAHFHKMQSDCENVCRLKKYSRPSHVQVPTQLVYLCAIASSDICALLLTDDFFLASVRGEFFVLLEVLLHLAKIAYHDGFSMKYLFSFVIMSIEFLVLVFE